MKGLNRLRRGSFVVAAAVVCVCSSPLLARQQTAPAATNGKPAVPVQAPLPPGFVIGPEDLLTVVFWRDREMSADVVVRPDGKISVPLLSDVAAAGYTPEQLAKVLETAASKYVTEPNATVIVREIRSRKVYVVGEVGRPGTVPLTADMNVLQVIAAVGGLLEHANKSDITILRKENGRERRIKFNYNDVIKGKRMGQNILLKPGDTVIVR